MVLTPYPGTFFHGIRLKDWHPCHNLRLSDCLWSPNYIAYTEKWADPPISKIPIQELRRGFLQGVVSPRLVKTFTKNNYCLEPEIAFEEGRRKTLPEAVSRLSCLYAANATEAGRENILQMIKEPYIATVTIPQAFRVEKVDRKWFDLYCKNPQPAYIESYWLSRPFNEHEDSWEYLIDGVIQVDRSDLEYVRTHGATLPIT